MRFYMQSLLTALCIFFHLKWMFSLCVDCSFDHKQKLTKHQNKKTKSHFLTFYWVSICGQHYGWPDDNLFLLTTCQMTFSHHSSLHIKSQIWKLREEKERETERKNGQYHITMKEPCSSFSGHRRHNPHNGCVTFTDWFPEHVNIYLMYQNYHVRCISEWNKMTCPNMCVH